MSTTTKTAPKRDRETEMAERFARETAHHELAIVHDDGLYRHLKARSAKPGEGWCYWFEVVTWPGRLVVTGDCGTYVFARLPDMFEFFRTGFDGRINPGYWGEKTSDAAALKKYSADVLREHLEQAVADYEQDFLADCPEGADYEERLAAWEALPAPRPPMPVAPAYPTPTRVRAEIAEHEDTEGLEHVESARQLLERLEDMHVVEDTWEWDLNDWDWQFLWCCHAIVWAIAQYDAEKATAARREARP